MHIQDTGCNGHLRLGCDDYTHTHIISISTRMMDNMFFYTTLISGDYSSSQRKNGFEVTFLRSAGSEL